MADSGGMTPSTQKVLILFFFLIALIALLIFLYKKLNKEANGEYTIRNVVYKEGGVRDQVRGAALALEMRLGVRLWPRGDTDEEGEEMQEVQDEEGQVEEGSGQGSDTEGENEEEEEEENVELCGRTKGKGDDTDTDGNSSVGSSEAGEEARLTSHSEGETGEKGEEKEEKVGDGEGKDEASGGAGLLIDLKQFSGSATWSAGGEGKDGVVTAL